MHSLALGTAFVAGLLGSTHCLAMCGGLATALGTLRAGAAPAWQPWIYQLGRVLSYGIGGSIVGGIGAVAGLAFEAAWWGEVLRLGTALVVVFLGLNIALGASSRNPWLHAPERWGAFLWRQLAPAARARLPTRPALRALALGLLWGWLPCGLVYSALLVAALAGSAVGGGATMIAFGLGTLPAMLGLSYAGVRLAPRSGTLGRLLGAGIVACGLWTASIPIAALTGMHHHASHTMVMTSDGPQDGGPPAKP
jgi:hypothetical protein